MDPRRPWATSWFRSIASSRTAGLAPKSDMQRKLIAPVGENTFNLNVEIQSKDLHGRHFRQRHVAHVRVKPLTQPSHSPRALAGLDGPPMPDSHKKRMPRICPNCQALAGERGLRPVGD